MVEKERRKPPPNHLKRHTSPLSVASRSRHPIPPPSTSRELINQTNEGRQRAKEDGEDSGIDVQSLNPVRPRTTREIRKQQGVEGRARMGESSLTSDT